MMMTMAPKVPRSPNLPPPVGARTQGPRPFFLLPAMNLLPSPALAEISLCLG